MFNNTKNIFLVQMICEEHGFFLEIVDIIRGFGLTILKGVMESREEKIWARFIVEAEVKHCTTQNWLNKIGKSLSLFN